MSDAYYFVLSYLNATNFAPVQCRWLCKFDKLTGCPIFKMDMLDYETFGELMHDGMNWMLSKSQDLTLENIDKYNLK